jgi:hypothetical protein
MLLRIISLLAVFTPTLLSMGYSWTKSYVVSWIYFIAALAVLPIFGLPLGIAINLYRLKWPWLYVLIVAVLQVSFMSASLLPKNSGGGGIERLTLPLIILVIEYLVFASLSGSVAE